jgi:hypothetical protein
MVNGNFGIIRDFTGRYWSIVAFDLRFYTVRDMSLSIALNSKTSWGFEKLVES